jgi:hypothetical protein
VHSQVVSDASLKGDVLLSDREAISSESVVSLGRSRDSSASTGPENGVGAGSMITWPRCRFIRLTSAKIGE